jgi:hypothetical protein
MSEPGYYENYRKKVVVDLRSTVFSLGAHPDADVFVWLVQRMLGLPADGLCGPNTERAVKAFVCGFKHHWANMLPEAPPHTCNRCNHQHAAGSLCTMWTAPDDNICGCDK